MNILRTIRPIAFWPPVLLFLAAFVYNFVNPGGFTTMRLFCYKINDVASPRRRA